VQRTNLLLIAAGKYDGEWLATETIRVGGEMRRVRKATTDFIGWIRRGHMERWKVVERPPRPVLVDAGSDPGDDPYPPLLERVTLPLQLNIPVRFDCKAISGERPRWQFGCYLPGKRRRAQYEAMLRCEEAGGSGFCLVCHGELDKSRTRPVLWRHGAWLVEAHVLTTLLNSGRCSLTAKELPDFGYDCKDTNWLKCLTNYGLLAEKSRHPVPDLQGKVVQP